MFKFFTLFIFATLISSFLFAQIPATYLTEYNNISSNNLTCADLKNALNTLVSTGQTTLSYGQLDNTQIPAVDQIPNDANTGNIIWDVYANNSTGPEPYEFNASQTYPGGFCGSVFPTQNGLCWNKEHTFPKSWFKTGSGPTFYQQPTESDLMVVRPTDGNLNSIRSNKIYATVAIPTSTFPTNASTYPGVPTLDKYGPCSVVGITAAAVEPPNGIKGDLARGYFYIVTRYQNNLANWISFNQAATDVELVVDGITASGLYPSLQLPYLKMLYQWHLADPVDARETNRNNLIYTQQNNRNPFVDHPEYVALMFQCTGVLPVTIIDFTAQINNETVLLQWYATQENSFKKYEVERSIDGFAFNKIGEVLGQNLANYHLNDNNLPKATMAYYRLKTIDIDGKFSYSKIAYVKLNFTTKSISLFPNPVASELNIKLYQNFIGNSSLVITDASGRIVKQENINTTTLNIKTNVKSLSAGRYFLKIMNDKQVLNESFNVMR